MKKTFTLSILLSAGLWSQSFAQTHTITIHPNNRAASLLMSGSEYQTYVANDGFNNDEIRQNLVKDIYQKFNDDFDFVFLVLNETAIPSNLTYYGQLMKVSNNIAGIGMNNYSNASSYGSRGKLQSVMALTALTYIKFGPTLHEIMHNWGNFAIQTATFENGQAFNDYKPHWGFTGGSTPGQLGGFNQSSLVVKPNNTYEVDAFGSFANGGNGLRYNKLELYIMGMIPVSEVDSFDVFSDITSASDGSGGKIQFVANTRTTWGPAKLTQDLGARNPSSGESQKHFRALFVVLTPTPLTETQWTTFDEQVNWFGQTQDDGTTLYNFWEATGGRATIETGNINLATGLSDVNAKDHYLVVGPNPATDQLNINTTQGMELKSVKVLNTLGQLMSETDFTSSAHYELNTSNLENGFYYIQALGSNGEVMNSKIQISK